MPSETDKTTEPAKHYDKVIDAWGFLLLEDLHYGYFETGTETLLTATDALTQQMLSLVKLSAGDKVLDIGCGTGKAACRIARETHSQVIGISPSSECVAAATAKAAELKLDELVQFQTGDGMAPDFPDASFTCAWVMESSHLMSDKAALLSECARVLKPGGRLTLCDVMLDHKLSFQESIQHAKGLILLKDVYGPGAMEPLSYYEEQCELNGMQIEHSRNISAETLLTFDHWHDNAVKNRAIVCEKIGEEAYQQFADSCDALRNFWQENILGYGIISASKPA